MAPPTTWMSETVHMLCQLWADGLSSSQIGDRLGRTRNAVIGKVYRLGLASRKGPQWQAPPHGKRRHGRDKSEAVQAPRSRMAPTKTVAAAIAVETAAPGLPMGLGVLELDKHHCRWPSGDPKRGFGGFCGQHARRWPYCDAHARMAYRPASRRRR